MILFKKLRSAMLIPLISISINGYAQDGMYIGTNAAVTSTAGTITIVNGDLDNHGTFDGNLHMDADDDNPHFIKPNPSTPGTFPVNLLSL